MATPKLRVKDYIKSFFYRLLRTEVPADVFNSCSKCKKRCRNFVEHPKTFKNCLVGYDRVLGEWVFFSDHNGYVKILVMNGYIVSIFTLSEKLWKIIRPLCRKCLNVYFETYVEEDDEA